MNSGGIAAMKKRARNNEGIPKGYPGIVWRTTRCPHCEGELRLWWAGSGHNSKSFCCRYCRRVFHMDRFGIIQGDLYEVIQSNIGTIKVVREIEDV